MQFQKPNTEANVRKAIFRSAVALAKLQFQDPLKGTIGLLSAADDVPEIWKDLLGKPTENPENIAWVFLSTSVATAAIMLLREPRMLGELTDEELANVGAMAAETVPDTGTLTADDLTNLALSPHVSAAIETIPELARQAAPNHPLSDGQLIQAFKDALAQAVGRVFERQQQLFGGVVQTVFGPAAEPERRSNAWKRHNAWIKSLFVEEPIFSPGNYVDIPLSHVYQPLRCIWNRQHEKQKEGESEPLRYRTAHIGDLHRTLCVWLETSPVDDPVRLIAGGPGCGKSSFSRAFASQIIDENKHNLLYIRLQHIQMLGNLRESIGSYLTRIHGLKSNKCEGFPENPLSWHGAETRPLFLIFDGLDELTANKDRAGDLTRRFLSNLKLELNSLNTAGPPARAIVLGREPAMQAALHEADESLESMVHVAPIRPINTENRSELHLDKNPPDDSIGDGFDPVSDPENLLKQDSRADYWRRWCDLQGLQPSDIPEAITSDEMSDLNVEPLLLHLLIISDYCGARWQEAKNNVNLVYEDILTQVFERNKKKELDAYKSLEKKNFFELMEVFGLAAFRGNGRTGTHDDFETLRKLFVPNKREKDVYSQIDGASLKNVALMVHSRKETEGAGFEFVHRSFGQYLAARAHIQAASMLAKRRRNDDIDDSDQRLALRWLDLIGDGVLDRATLRFLRNQALLKDESLIETVVGELTEIFDGTLRDGFPAHKSVTLDQPTYRTLETRQRCAEVSMLATLTALWSAKRDKTTRIELKNLNDQDAASVILARIYGAIIPPQLSGLNLSYSFFFNPDLSEADLRGATLRGSFLQGATLYMANLSGADLRGAELGGADFDHADLRGADLQGAYGQGVHLSVADLSKADLRNAHLHGVYLKQANLSRANLFDTNLSGADLSGADLSDASLLESDFSGANLSGAILSRAGLNDSNLSEANLSEADLNEADLRGTDLREASLHGANLRGADLSNADLRWAKLIGADLSGAKVEFTNLNECQMVHTLLRLVDFSESHALSLEQVHASFGVKAGFGLTRLPPGLSYPEHWHVAEDAEEDSASLVDRYNEALRHWLEQ